MQISTPLLVHHPIILVDIDKIISGQLTLFCSILYLAYLFKLNYLDKTHSQLHSSSYYRISS